MPCEYSEDNRVIIRHSGPASGRSRVGPGPGIGRPGYSAAEDAKRKEEVDTRNQADQMVYQSEKTLSEMGDKIPADDKSKVQAGIDKLKEVLKGTDTAAIKTATDELTQAFYAVSEKLYQQANPQGGQPGPDMGGAGFGGQQAGGAAGGSGNKGPDDVVDADYTVVDDQ